MEKTAQKNTEVALIIEQNGLEKTQAEKLVEPLMNFLNEAKGWEKKAQALVVTDVSQTKEMAEARTARLELKKIRTGAEKIRVELKERSIREGKMIDGVANIIKGIIIPIEEHLEKQEKFSEELEKTRKEKILAERTVVLQKFESDPALYNLKEMSDEAFAKLATDLEIAFKAKKEAAEKAEKDRLQKQKEKDEEDEKVRLENIRLKKEAADKEALRLKEKADADKKQAESDKKLKEAADEKARLEKQIEDKKKSDEIERRRLEKQAEDDKKAAADAAKKAAEAPDKAKLLDYASKIKDIPTPVLTSETHKVLLKKAQKKLFEVSQELENALLEF